MHLNNVSTASVLETGPRDAAYRFILAHGAGAGATSPFLEEISRLLADRGIAVTRFEFAYMAARHHDGKRRPPPKAEKLIPEYEGVLRATLDKTAGHQRLIIGGKSMGGRVASMIAESAFQKGEIAALVCLGYPFHPPKKPETLRISHLKTLSCPALIVQGERDPFGNRDEISALDLPSCVNLTWIGDGDHDLGPRGASGFTRKGNLAAAADAVAEFLTKLPLSAR